jgi:glycerate dehydrogenase
MKRKMVILDGYTLNPGDLSWDGLSQMGELQVYDRTGTDEKLILERSRPADILFTNKTKLPGHIIEQLPDLEYIGVLATGYDVVDVEAAAARGIPVANVPTYGTDSVAQMVFAHILHFCHHVREHSDAVKSGEWTRRGDFCFWLFPLVELAGKTMGIIGFGRIGRRVGEIARAFGMRVMAHDLNRTRTPSWGHFSWAEMDELLARSDFISLNCALTPENRGMINKESLQKMKAGCFLVNCSRGGLVIDQDLADALDSGVIAGAGIDVLGTEPPGLDNPLYKAANITITPHIAWATREARTRLMNTTIENLRAFLDGAPVNVVNGV